MSCCGSGRAELVIQTQAKPETMRQSAWGAVTFEYTGRSALTVIGPITRTTYYFQGPGSRTLVDGRDSLALASMRMLRRV
jgi:hypothetical protein